MSTGQQEVAGGSGLLSPVRRCLPWPELRWVAEPALFRSSSGSLRQIHSVQWSQM